MPGNVHESSKFSAPRATVIFAFGSSEICRRNNGSQEYGATIGIGRMKALSSSFQIDLIDLFTHLAGRKHYFVDGGVVPLDDVHNTAMAAEGGEK